MYWVKIRRSYNLVFIFAFLALPLYGGVGSSCLSCTTEEEPELSVFSINLPLPIVWLQGKSDGGQVQNIIIHSKTAKNNNQNLEKFQALLYKEGFAKLYISIMEEGAVDVVDISASEQDVLLKIKEMQTGKRKNNCWFMVYKRGDRLEGIEYVIQKSGDTSVTIFKADQWKTLDAFMSIYEESVFKVGQLASTNLNEKSLEEPRFSIMFNSDCCASLSKKEIKSCQLFYKLAVDGNSAAWVLPPCSTPHDFFWHKRSYHSVAKAIQNYFTKDAEKTPQQKFSAAWFDWYGTIAQKNKGSMLFDHLNAGAQDWKHALYQDCRPRVYQSLPYAPETNDEGVPMLFGEPSRSEIKKTKRSEKISGIPEDDWWPYRSEPHRSHNKGGGSDSDGSSEGEGHAEAAGDFIDGLGELMDYEGD